MEARITSRSQRSEHVGVRRITRSETRGPEKRADSPIDDKPKSVYELITRQMLEELKSDVADIKGRVNALIWLVVGAVVVEVVMRLVK